MFKLDRRQIAAMALGGLALGTGSGQLPNSAEHAAIAYSSTAPKDSIARLQDSLDRGELELTFDDRRGFLPSLLERLEIPHSSQSLVFSRTSLQVDRIAPWTPRAIYFNDNVYIGWVQGGPVIEIASVDPDLGAVFYTLPQEGTAPPRFERQTATCLMCHDSSSVTGGVPGFIVRSVFPDRYGYPITVREQATTDQTPIGQRWGGWYVTGTRAGGAHEGNRVAEELVHEVGNVQSYMAKLETQTGEELTELTSKFDPSPYLSPHSDLVALLVLTHQTYVHNSITIANYEALKAIHDEELLLTAMGSGAPRGHSQHLEPTIRRIENATEPLVRAILFVREAPLGGPVQGTSDFAMEFAARGPHDSKGRSLRDLDLETRLFRYPLSFLIYSASFDALPPQVKTYVYRRLRRILTGGEEADDFAHLSADDRKAILEILTDTKPDFAAAP